ncbi:MAG TPA: hypothetical protein VMW58_08695 [Anaerolineae bacterium]|nr:hypothetical protein [Anaerolineae bacterium]
MSITTDQAIDQCIAQLTAEEATGLDAYKAKLENQEKVPENVCDLLCECRAALMFLRNGFEVEMRESPDLRIELDEEVVYVEVTHFREKGQDRVDEKAMQETADLLVPIGDIVESEGATAWTQIANKAKSKASQYVSDAANILVVESSSDSLALMLGSAVHQYDDEVLNSDDLRLRRLSAMMLINTRSIACGADGWSNVEFCQTAHATVPLSATLASALWKIRIDLV